MGSSIHVVCLNNNKSLFVPKGSTLKDLLKEFGITSEYPILGAVANNFIKDLTYEVYHPTFIFYFDITHPEGIRMYNRSLYFLLCKAFQDLFPEERLRIEHSIAKGTYCSVTNRQLSEQEVLSLEDKMKELIAADLPITYVEEATTDVIQTFEKLKMTDKSELLNHVGRLHTNYYRLEDYYNSFYGPLVASTGQLKTFGLSKYYEGLLLQFPKANNPAVVEEKIQQVQLFEIFREYREWTSIQGIRNISDLNKEVVKGKSEVVIKISEALHEKKIVKIADTILQNKDKIRVIFISGPSSSGKTTFSKRLSVQLLVNGIKSLNLSLDNYFVDREHTPLDENNQPDFEAFESIDHKQFVEDIRKLVAGEEIRLCKFSFEKGKRFYNHETARLRTDEVIVVEGIHGLNPRLTSLFKRESYYKIYVSALTSLNVDEHNPVGTSDNRLIRRIVRDYKYRKYSAHETISRWPSVRRGEEKNIFPFQEEADIMFNSALIYELAVLKPYAERILLEVLPNQPEYAESNRLLFLLSLFRTLKPDEIPPTSILREFLGGSSFFY